MFACVALIVLGGLLIVAAATSSPGSLAAWTGVTATVVLFAVGKFEEYKIRRDWKERQRDR